MMIIFLIHLVFATKQVEYKFGSSFGDLIYDFSDNQLSGASGYYGSLNAKSTDRGIYIDGSDHSIVLQESYSNEKLSSPFTITLWTMPKIQLGMIFYRSRSNSNYISINGKTVDATIGFKVVISGTASEYFCPADSFEAGKWTLAQLVYQSSIFTFYTQTCTIQSTTLTYSESNSLLYYTCLGSYRSNMPAFYGYVWYFNINLAAESPSVYVENGPIYSCETGPCTNCSYAFKDPDYGNICLSEETDDTKNAYSESCTGTSGCSKTLNLQCSCSTSSCIYSPSTSTCGCVDSSFVVTSSNCQCNSPYKSISGKCCYPSCSSCATSNVCTGCSDPNAEVISELCECKAGYYGTPSSTSTTGCISCNPGCNTCAITICDSCFDINAEIIASSCVCKSGFYGTPSGISSDQCKSCGYGCSDCISNTTCNTCIDPNAEGSTGDCLCNTGFYGNASITNITSCFPCKDKCSVCQDSNTCSLCSDTNAQVQNNECVCKTGFYLEVLNNSLCQSCSYGCYNCSETQCFACFDPQAQPNGSNCECQPGYFGTPSNNNDSLCIQCGTGCSQCTAVNNCLSCFEENAEVISGECVCKSGFYGTPSDNDGCKSCILGCSLCLDYISCTQTFDPNAEILNNEVRCKNGFFGQIDNSNQSCFQCNSECRTCHSENNCSECWLNNYQIIEGRCKCLDGFYLSPNGNECIECPDQCLTCIDNGNCIDCKTENSIFDKKKGCVCKTGYYNSTLPTGNKCEKCMDECKECKNEFTCKKCKNAFTVLNSTGRCTCKEGYYNSNPTNTSIKCEPCDSACKSCNNEGVCVDCLGNNTEINENGKCECLNKFYSNSSTYIDCEDCPGFRIEGKCDSFCPIGFGWVNGTCNECGELCNECDEELRCFNCTSGAKLVDGKCNCSKGFKKVENFCESKFFYSNCKFEEKDLIELRFSETPEIDINNLNLKVEFNKKKRKFIVEKQALDNFVILDLEFKKNESGHIVIEILNKPLYSINESELYNYIQELDLEFESNEFSIISFVTKVAMLILFFASLSINPSTFWSLFNTIKMILFMPLNSVPYSSRILKFIIAIKDLVLIPNFIPYIFNSESTSTPNKYCIRNDITSSVFWLNFGLYLFIFIAFLTIWLFFSVLHSMGILKKYSNKVIRNYKYNFFIRFFFQSYLELGIYSIIQMQADVKIVKSGYFNFVSAIVLIVPWSLAPFVLFLGIYKKKDKLKSQKFVIKYGSAFNEFKIDNGVWGLLYYPLFLVCRLEYTIVQLLLVNVTGVQCGLNIVFSAIQLGYLLKFRPHKHSPTLISEISGQLCIFLSFILALFLMDNKNILSLENIENFFIYQILGTICFQYLISIYVLSSSIKKFCVQKIFPKFKKSLRLSTKVYPERYTSINKSATTQIKRL